MRVSTIQGKTMLGKNVIVLLISSFSLWSGNTFAQNTSCTISMDDVFIPGILSIGSYSQLIESQGYPNSSFPSTVNPINPLCIKECGFVAPSNVVQCEYLVYDAFEYIHIGDSVQLVFIDLRKTIFPLFIKDFVINRTVSQKEFLYKIKKRGWWSNELDEYKIGKIESHYCTDTDVNCFYLDYAEDPYSSVIFTFYAELFSNKIWYIEFPVMRIGGIIH